MLRININAVVETSIEIAMGLTAILMLIVVFTVT